MALADSLPSPDVSVKVHTFAIGPFTYEVAQITPRCFTLKALHTGAVRQFASRAALGAFVEALREHLDAPTMPTCPICGRKARRMVVNPVNADMDICWHCHDGINAMLDDDMREWDYDRRGAA
jgi:hypothetical protein